MATQSDPATTYVKPKARKGVSSPADDISQAISKSLKEGGVTVTVPYLSSFNARTTFTLSLGFHGESGEHILQKAWFQAVIGVDPGLNVSAMSVRINTPDHTMQYASISSPVS